jgi:hypothetical protein
MGELLATLFGVPLLFGLVLWAIHRSFRGLDGYRDPRELGVIVASEDELDGVAPRVGTYHDSDIHEWVRYKGDRYDFAFVTSAPYQMRLKHCELYLPPGIVYTRQRG